MDDKTQNNNRPKKKTTGAPDTGKRRVSGAAPPPTQKTASGADGLRRGVPLPSKSQSTLKRNATPPLPAPGETVSPASGRKLPSLSSKATEETVIFQDNAAQAMGRKSKVSQDTQPMLIRQQKNKIVSLFKPREKKPNFILSIVLTVAKLLFVAVLVFVAVGAGSVIGVANAYLETTPELDKGKIEDQSLTSYIYDQNSNLLTVYSGQENRDWAEIAEIPEHLRNAFIAVEDIRFYEHSGVDFRRLAGAFISNLNSSSVQGGSTITQQLLKNKLLTNERSYKRKLQEAYLATKLEETYDKDEILEAYLNTIPLGGKVYGVKTAAKDYFGKELDALTLKEMVCIAAITQSTTKFNPRRATYVKPENLPYLINRMNIITERMLWSDMITEEEYNETFTPKETYLTDSSIQSLEQDEDRPDLQLRPGYLSQWKSEMNILDQSPANAIYKYPHFVEYVIQDVQSFLLKKHELEDTPENRLIVDREMRAGGYRIYATIDTEMQETVQNALTNWESYPGFQGDGNDEVIKLDHYGNPQTVIQPQAAAVVIDNETGYLRAIIGSRETPDQMRTFNRATDGAMEIGSSIKPIAVYGPAFDTGYSLASSVANIPVPIQGWTVTDSDPGYPDMTGEEGPLSLHDAIVKSINVAAARTVAELVTLPVSTRYLQQLGVNPDHIEGSISGLSMGNSPITPVEMVGAYSTIPRGGEYLQPVSFDRVVDSKGTVIIDVEKERERHQGLKQTTAWMLNEALTDAVDHGTGTNAKIEGITTAGKTGTVSKNRGAAFCGYTYKYTSMLWIGHDEFKSFTGGTGGAIAAPLWRTYMTEIHAGMSDREVFPGEPESYGMVKGQVCKYSNLKLSSSCSPGPEDWMAASDVPMVECTWCGGGGGVSYCSSSYMALSQYCPEETHAYKRYYDFPEESPYSQWIGSGRGGISSETCDVHTYEWYESTLTPVESDDAGTVTEIVD